MTTNGGGISPTRLAIGLALISFAIALGANVGLSVVLERAGASALPALTLLNGVVLAAATASVSLLGRGAALRSLTVALLLAAALVVVCATGEGTRTTWSANVLYLVSCVLGDLCAALFWSLANELYDARSAKKVFPRVGAAGTAGAALAGVVARALGGALGARGLVVLWVASLVAAAVWAIRVDTKARTSLPAEASRAPRPWRAARKKRVEREDRALVWALAVGFVLVICVTAVGRYLYSWCLSASYGADAVAIAKLNGLLNAVASVVTAIVQLLLTPLLLARWGIRRTMLVYPGALVLVFGLLFLHPGLAGGVAVFFATSILRRGVQGPVESVLPTGLLRTDGSRTVLLLTAIGAPVGMLLAGAALLFGRAGPVTSVSVLGFVLSAVLGAVSVWRARAYLSALRLRLSKGGSDLRQRLLGRMASTQEAQSMLVDDLDANDPRLIEQLEALVRARSDHDYAAPEAWRADSTLARIALARLAEAYRLHASLSRLPTSAADGRDAARWEGARELWLGSIRNRIGEDLRVVILVLRAATGHVDLDRISRRIFDADPRARGAAVEILDALCPEDLRPLLVPLVEQVGMSVAAEKASRRFGAPAVDPIDDLLAVPDVWIRACTAYALHWMDGVPYRTRLLALKESTDPFLCVAITHALEPRRPLHVDSRSASA